MKVLMILGSGGHTAQMIRLSEMLSPAFAFAYIVGYDDALSVNKIKVPGEVYFVHRARSHKDNILTTGFKVLRLFVESFVAYLRIRPDAVISVGPGIAVPISAICKLFKKKVIFIEDWSRVYQKSKTGMVMYHISDLFFVQWPELTRLFPKAIYAGRLA